MTFVSDRYHKLPAGVVGIQQFRCPDQYGQDADELLSAAAGQQCDHRPSRIKPVPLAKIASAAVRMDLGGKRISDVLDMPDTAACVPVLFKRQDRQEQVDVTFNRPDAVSPPRPELR